MKLNHIKNSFENRKIEPSSGAWDQLASRLDQEEKKSKKPIIYWLSAIAAMIVFGCFLYPLVTNNIEPIEKQNHIVVDSKSTVIEAKSSQNEELIKENIITPKKEIEIVSKDNLDTRKNKLPQTTSSSSNSNYSTPKEKYIKNEVSVPSEIAATAAAPKAEEKTKNNFIPEEHSIEPAIANAISQNKTPTLNAEQEMELLLNKALHSTRLNEFAGQEMDTDQLLRETEWDIKADRRNKVNDIIYDQLGKLKSEAYTLIAGNK